MWWLLWREERRNTPGTKWYREWLFHRTGGGALWWTVEVDGGGWKVSSGAWWHQHAANPIFVQRILIFKWELSQSPISGPDVSWWAFTDDYVCELWPNCALALIKCSQHARSARVGLHISAFISHWVVSSLWYCSKAVLIFLLKNVYVLTSWWLKNCFLIFFCSIECNKNCKIYIFPCDILKMP